MSASKEQVAAVSSLIIPGECCSQSSSRPVSAAVARLCRAGPGIGLLPDNRHSIAAAAFFVCPALCSAVTSPPACHVVCPAGGESTTMALVAEKWGFIPELQHCSCVVSTVFKCLQTSVGLLVMCVSCSYKELQ
jgi:hypothetical protein